MHVLERSQQGSLLFLDLVLFDAQFGNLASEFLLDTLARIIRHGLMQTHIDLAHPRSQHADLFIDVVQFLLMHSTLRLELLVHGRFTICFRSATATATTITITNMTFLVFT